MSYDCVSWPTDLCQGQCEGQGVEVGVGVEGGGEGGQGEGEEGGQQVHQVRHPQKHQQPGQWTCSTCNTQNIGGCVCTCEMFYDISVWHKLRMRRD